jgi:hypothetical protein
VWWTGNSGAGQKKQFRVLGYHSLTKAYRGLKNAADVDADSIYLYSITMFLSSSWKKKTT